MMEKQKRRLKRQRCVSVIAAGMVFLSLAGCGRNAQKYETVSREETVVTEAESRPETETADNVLRIETEAKAIENAVNSVLDDGWRTGDIAGSHIEEVKKNGKLVGTKKMGSLVVEYLNK